MIIDECKCGIHRPDCEFHRVDPRSAAELGPSIYWGHNGMPPHLCYEVVRMPSNPHVGVALSSAKAGDPVLVNLSAAAAPEITARVTKESQ